MAVLVVALVGCDSGNDPDPTVDGRWSGTMTFQGAAANISMDLLENNQRVTGTGIAGTFTMTLTGTHRYPDLSLVISVVGFLDSNYSGILSDDGRTITGIWTDPDFGGIPLTLRK